MMEHNKCFRQGEIVFIPVQCGKHKDTIIKSAKVMKTKVIREGEVSGHMHEIVGNGKLMEYPRKNNFYSYGSDVDTLRLPEGDMFITADNTIKIKHPEHKELSLPKGEYIVRIQREYNDANSNSRVQD